VKKHNKRALIRKGKKKEKKESGVVLHMRDPMREKH